MHKAATNIFFTKLIILLIVSTVCADTGNKELVNHINHQPDVEQLLIQLTNEVRSQHGLQPLQPHPALTRTARIHNKDMIEKNYTAHTNLQGFNPADRVSKQLRAFVGLATENIWLLTGTLNGLEYIDPMLPVELAQRVIKEWLESPPHRQNLLQDGLSHIGIGVSVTNGKLLVTQLLVHKAGELKKKIPTRIETGSFLRPGLITDEGAKEIKFGLEYYDEKTSSWIRHPGLFDRLVKIPDQPGLFRLLYLESTGDAYKIFKGPAFIAHKQQTINDEKRSFLTNLINP